MNSWLASKLPTREQLLANRWMRPFAHRLTHPLLWHFNRWSVARGLALGLFVGFLVPLGQTPVAAMLALSVRANLIVAAVATLITNPITFPAIYYAAFQVGQRLLTTEGWARSADAADTLFLSSISWFLSVSAPTALGLFVFGTASATLGYFGVHLGWRAWVQRRWARRASRNAARV